MSAIKDVMGLEVIDSRGDPTVEAEVVPQPGGRQQALPRNTQLREHLPDLPLDLLAIHGALLVSVLAKAESASHPLRRQLLPAPGPAPPHLKQASAVPRAR